jgi:hypothetical protein
MVNTERTFAAGSNLGQVISNEVGKLRDRMRNQKRVLMIRKGLTVEKL